MFEKLFKNNTAMGWIALLTLALSIAYIVDQYGNKDFFGLAKKAPTA